MPRSRKPWRAGGTVFEEAEDHGFMYAHSFLDPDGHGWNLIHMAADRQDTAANP